MSSTIPETNLAVVIQPDRTFAVERIPVLKPGPGEVLLKVHAIAQNPSEWRANTYPFVKAGTVAGCDLAGEIVAIGEGGHDADAKLAIGDRVAAFTQGAFTPRYASFRQFSLIKSSPLLHIPANISYEEAASIPLTACTAVLGFKKLFGFPDIPPLGKSILIWGGSSSLGMYAIQLARISNLHIVTTSSPHNFSFLQSLGAHVVLDYHSPTIVEDVRSATGGGVDYVLDALSESYTIKLAAEGLKKGAKKIATMLPVKEEDRLEGVEYHFVFMATLLGDDADLRGIYFPPNHIDYALGKHFYTLLNLWLSNGKFKPSPLTVRPGGLYGVPEGIAEMIDGKVSGTKLVYRVTDTREE